MGDRCKHNIETFKNQTLRNASKIAVGVDKQFIQQLHNHNITKLRAKITEATSHKTIKAKTDFSNKTTGSKEDRSTESK